MVGLDLDVLPHAWNRLELGGTDAVFGNAHNTDVI